MENVLKFINITCLVIDHVGEAFSNLFVKEVNIRGKKIHV